MRQLYGCLALATAIATGCNNTAKDGPKAAGTPSLAATQPPTPSAPAPATGRPKASAVPAASAPPATSVASAAPPPPAAPPGMLIVPGATFNRGADSGGERDERPRHQVTLPGFFLDKTEVTNGQYLECVGAKKCRMYRTDGTAGKKEFRGKDQPVMGVSWDDAKTYCEWKDRRLPTEAEWELAAGGTDDRTYPWGNDKPDRKKHGCFAGYGYPKPVASFPEGAGPYGHLDLAGNVWEWVQDMYDPYAYRRDTAKVGKPGSCEQITATLDELRKTKQFGFTGSNPIPVECERVLRGGAYNYRGDGLRVTNRVHHPGTWRLPMAGFRCAKSLQSDERKE